MPICVCVVSYEQQMRRRDIRDFEVDDGRHEFGTKLWVISWLFVVSLLAKLLFFVRSVIDIINLALKWQNC